MNPLRIGTRESELALWQANTVRSSLEINGIPSELVMIKSDGDVDLHTPLYEMGVQGIFTRSLDIALLNGKIDIAVHSMKDVPTVLPKGIRQAAVLPRGNHMDLLVYKDNWKEGPERPSVVIATSSIRRKAQWLNRYPDDELVNLRGNVNTRLEKLFSNPWQGAIFAAAGLERINKRPVNAVELEWMLPAPAQGAIMVVCRDDDDVSLSACAPLNDSETALCTGMEREFLRTLMGGCSMPVSAHAFRINNKIWFRGNILTTDGRKKAEVEKYISPDETNGAGNTLALELLKNGGAEIAEELKGKR